MLDETTRWGVEQVLALAPDVSAHKAARGLASPRTWRETGCGEDPPSLWGLCQGSGAHPYQVCVDLVEPAYRCSCPSRKFPCKHALALMLLWSAGSVGIAPPPDFVAQWHTSRGERQQKATTRAEAKAAKPTQPGPSKTTHRRDDRVEAGLAELDRWLTDQVRQGLATVSRLGYAHWDTMAARLVDAQAPGVASAVRRLAAAAGTPDRLLTELSLIHLLAAGHRRLAELPAELAATVRGLIGFPVSTEDVLAGPRVRDDWAVVGIRDEGDDRLTVRRCWLRGVSTGQAALVLSFAAPGQSLSADLVHGTVVDADVCFYPGALPLRALVAHRHGPARPLIEPPGALTIGQALDVYAEAVAAQPWLDRWPMLLAGVTPVADTAGHWYLRDEAGDALPLDPTVGPPWRAVAAGGGAPATIAVEWSPNGSRLLTMWADARMARL